MSSAFQPAISRLASMLSSTGRLGSILQRGRYRLLGTDAIIVDPSPDLERVEVTFGEQSVMPFLVEDDKQAFADGKAHWRRPAGAFNRLGIAGERLVGEAF